MRLCLCYYKRLPYTTTTFFLLKPRGNVFYVQKISELEIKQNKEYDATTDFEKLEHIFKRVKAKDISHFKNQALQIMMKSHS